MIMEEKSCSLLAYALIAHDFSQDMHSKLALQFPDIKPVQLGSVLPHVWRHRR